MHEIVDFSACVTLKFDWWPLKTIEKLFRVPERLLCHLIAICEFKLELSSKNAQIEAKSASLRAV